MTAVLVDRLGAGAVSGCDPSEAFVAEYARRHPTVEVRQGRAEDIPFDNDAFDIVLAQRVCGPLAGSGTSEDDVLLDLGVDYPSPDRFQIVIWDVGGVDSIPFGSTVCTTGPIALYNGVPEIALHSASEVEIYK